MNPLNIERLKIGDRCVILIDEPNGTPLKKGDVVIITYINLIDEDIYTKCRWYVTVKNIRIL